MRLVPNSFEINQFSTKWKSVSLFKVFSVSNCFLLRKRVRRIWFLIDTNIIGYREESSTEFSGLEVINVE